MGRLAKFSEEQILDAALHLVATGGPNATTIGAIAAALDAPVGSIYYRFKSRDLLLARLWFRTIKRFQAGFLIALGGEDLDEAARQAALHVVGWVREHMDEARLLLLFRREDLAAQWPGELGNDLATLNEDVLAALQNHARRRFGDDSDGLERVVFALVDVPSAAVRRHLRADTSPPPSIDKLIASTCRCILTGPQTKSVDDIPARPRRTKRES